MTRDTRPLYVSRSTRGELTNAALIVAWFVAGVVVAVHEVVNHG